MSAIAVRTRGGRATLRMDHPGKSCCPPVLLVAGVMRCPETWPYAIHVPADADPRVVTAAVKSGFDIRQEDERRSR